MPVHRHAHWLLRAPLVAVFVYHGSTKLQDLDGMAGMLGFSKAVILLTALLEIGGSVLLVVGGLGPDIATRLGAAAYLPVMIGAIAKFHWPQWSFVASKAHPMGGMEFQVTVAMLAVYFLAVGNTTAGRRGVVRDGERAAERVAG
jgi:putative oxidoreductase